jgi:hypothetical protein
MCSIKIHLVLVSWVLMIKNQVATLTFLTFVLFLCITINSQLYMENMSSCSICKLKIFLMVSWESNLDHVYYLHFCPNMSQKVGTSWNSKFQNGKTIWECWDSLFHTCGSVFESHDILSTYCSCFSFGHEPKTRVTTIMYN